MLGFAFPFIPLHHGFLLVTVIYEPRPARQLKRGKSSLPACWREKKLKMPICAVLAVRHIFLSTVLSQHRSPRACLWSPSYCPSSALLSDHLKEALFLSFSKQEEGGGPQLVLTSRHTPTCGNYPVLCLCGLFLVFLCFRLQTVPLAQTTLFILTSEERATVECVEFPPELSGLFTSPSACMRSVAPRFLYSFSHLRSRPGCLLCFLSPTVLRLRRVASCRCSQQAPRRRVGPLSPCRSLCGESLLRLPLQEKGPSSSRRPS